MSRRLEIGPGDRPLPGFETLNLVDDGFSSLVMDASHRLPIGDDTYDLIYASHVLEHIAWYKTDSVLQEWLRILKPGGTVEIWVPDGLKICEALVAFERTGVDNTGLDGWYRLNPSRDPCLWAAGRIFTYGDETGDRNHPNWHCALFTPRYLQRALSRAGFREVHLLDRAQVRGYDHGWINLGATGKKQPC